MECWRELGRIFEKTTETGQNYSTVTDWHMRCSFGFTCYDPAGGNALSKVVDMASLAIVSQGSRPAPVGDLKGPALRRRHDGPVSPISGRVLRSLSEEGNPLLERLLLAQRRGR